jgi:hypothetical protein
MATKTNTTNDAAQQELERLRKENEELQQKLADRGGTGALSLKVSGKGAISAYGLGRFPTTLYIEQWNKILDNADQIRQFMKDHESQLKRKS